MFLVGLEAQVNEGLAREFVVLPGAARTVAGLSVDVPRVVRAVSLSLGPVRGGAKGSIAEIRPNGEANEFVVLGWVSKLAGTELIEVRDTVDAGDVVVHDGVWLLDHDDIGVRAR